MHYEISGIFFYKELPLKEQSKGNKEYIQVFVTDWDKKMSSINIVSFDIFEDEKPVEITKEKFKSKLDEAFNILMSLANG